MNTYLNSAASESDAEECAMLKIDDRVSQLNDDPQHTYHDTADDKSFGDDDDQSKSRSTATYGHGEHPVQLRYHNAAECN